MSAVGLNNVEMSCAGRSIGDVQLAVKFSLNNGHMTSAHVPNGNVQSMCEHAKPKNAYDDRCLTTQEHGIMEIFASIRRGNLTDSQMDA